jgi:HAD superfamily hydrolase (TIGR01490 family)
VAQLSVFDLDRTLIDCNSSFQFCRFLISKGVLPLSALGHASYCYLRLQMGRLSLFDLHQTIFHKILRGLPVEQLEEHVGAFIEQVISRALYAPATACLKLAQHLGHHTAIFSTAPQFLVREIARFFEVGTWEATEYAVDRENRLCSVERVVQGEDKANFVFAMEKGLGLSRDQVTAYSDSYLDLPFLLSAGTAVAVNPDRKLRAHSKHSSWSII